MSDPALSFAPMPDPAPVVLPAALRPRAEEAPLVARAEAAAGRLAPYAESERLEASFRLGAQELAGAVRGLEGMRAVLFAPEVATQALSALEGVLDALEATLETLLPALEAERRARASAIAGRRPTAPRPRRRPAGA